MDDVAIWALEERLWLEGPELYHEVLHPACLMAFPEMGVMHASDIFESLEQAPRWQSVTMSGKAVARPDRETIVLGYEAEGRRAGAEAYVAYCTSTYRWDGGRWRLVQHQQTLVR